MNESGTPQKMIDAKQGHLFDILIYVSFLTQPISRTQKEQNHQKTKFLKN